MPEPQDIYDSNKHVPNTFSNEFFEKYKDYFNEDDLHDESTIHVAIKYLYSKLKDAKTMDLSRFALTRFAKFFLKKDYYQKEEEIKEIMETIILANKYKLWKKCWEESETMYKDCPKKSIISKIKSTLKSMGSRKNSNSANSRKGGKRKNRCKTKKYRNKFV